MIEIYHSTRELGAVLKEGIKCVYQLGLEKKGNHYMSPDDVNKRSTPKETKLANKSIFFFKDEPILNTWVSILVDENDESVKVGNMNLVNVAYQPGKLYGKSVMNLPTFLARINQPLKPVQDCVNPFTARGMDYDQMTKFENRWGGELEAILGEHNLFEYTPEILIPRMIIPPSEFHGTSMDY